MSVISFSAVAATDIFTSVAHGQNTGDGAAQALVAGGVANGLDESLDYYFRRIDADTFTLHPTAADAIANTNIVDVTADTNGQLGIGLPFRRARTYVPKAVSVPGSQLKSADLNTLQDDVINRRHGLLKVALPPVIVNNALGTSWALEGSTPGMDTVASTAAGVAMFEVPCEVGDTILGVEVLAQGDAAVDAQIDLYYLSAAMAETSIASLNDVNRAAAWGVAVVSSLSAGPPTPHKIADGERLRLRVNANAANYQVAQIKLIKHRGA